LGDPNFRPADKSEFAIDRSARPTRHIKVDGHDIIEEVAPPAAMNDEVWADTLLEGVTAGDSRGKESGFARFAATQPGYQKTGEAGSGPPSTDKTRRTENRDYSNSISPELDQGYEFSEDVGKIDLLMQDYDKPREEFGDIINQGDPSQNETREVTSPNQFDEEDIWSLDILEDFDENRKREWQRDEPTFSGQPHRQREARLADELDNLFDSTDRDDTFSKRGL